MYKKLLVPVDGGELTDRAMTQSIDLARQLGAAIVAFVVEPDMPLPNVGTRPGTYQRQMNEHETRTDTHALDVLSRFGEQARAAGVEFSGRHARTDAVDRAIAQTASELECDMIVMATHGRGLFGELLFGSHTKNVLSKSPIPLLVLH
jgi:nucleotide-binding universal stress UspA family protein